MLCFDLGSLLDGPGGIDPHEAARRAPPGEGVLAAIPEALKAYRVVIVPGDSASDGDVDRLRREVRSHLCERYGLQRGYLMFTLLQFSTRRRLSPSARRAHRLGPDELRGAAAGWAHA
jgi:hypothetical protein